MNMRSILASSIFVTIAKFNWLTIDVKTIDWKIKLPKLSIFSLYSFFLCCCFHSSYFTLWYDCDVRYQHSIVHFCSFCHRRRRWWRRRGWGWRWGCGEDEVVAEVGVGVSCNHHRLSPVRYSLPDDFNIDICCYNERICVQHNKWLHLISFILSFIMSWRYCSLWRRTMQSLNVGATHDTFRLTHTHRRTILPSTTIWFFTIIKYI